MKQRNIALRVVLGIGLEDGVTLTDEALRNAAVNAVHEAILKARAERPCLQIARIELATVDLDKPSGPTTTSNGQAEATP